MSFRSLDDADVKGKRVLVRVDLNVPMQDGKVSDATRIEEAAADHHRDRRQGRQSDSAVAFWPTQGARSEIFAAAGRRRSGADCETAGGLCRRLRRPESGSRDCRHEERRHSLSGEHAVSIPRKKRTITEFAKRLAALGDVFVDEAFSVAHRAHAANASIVTASNLIAYPGRAMQAELDALKKAFETPQHPVAAIVGGAKISTKLELLGHLLEKVDTLIIGGGMANTFLAAQGKPVGKSLCENDLIPAAREILAKAKSLHREIVLPVDVVVAQKLTAFAPSRVVAVDEVGPDDMILDIGPRSIEYVVSALARAKTLVWNGPFGAFEVEPFDNGTIEVAEAAAELTAAGKLVSFAGGGDTVAALNKAGVTSRLTHVSTAGGAFLESLEGKTLPGVEVLKVSPTPAMSRG